FTESTKANRLVTINGPLGLITLVLTEKILACFTVTVSLSEKEEALTLKTKMQAIVIKVIFFIDGEISKNQFSL
ncbi:MAG: hypothetical protein QMB65_01670, partial [Vicingaceae bacterium]